MFVLTVDFNSIPALLYSAFGVIIEKTRGAEDDLNTVAAGTMTGMLYKSTGTLAKLPLLILVLRTGVGSKVSLSVPCVLNVMFSDL